MKWIALLLLLIFPASRISTFLEKDARAHNAFSLRMLAMEESISKKENSVLCTYGIRNCFGLLYPGASAATKEEFQQHFGFHSDPVAQLSIQRESNLLLKKNSKSSVYLANSVWLRNHYPIDACYKKIMTENAGTIRTLSSALELNNWVAKETNNEIKQLLTENEVAPLQLMLANCVTMDALWESPFEVNATKLENFYTPKGAVQAPTMSGMVHKGTVFQNDTMLLAQLPFQDNLAMTIVMPKVKDFKLEWNKTMELRLKGEKDFFEDYRLWTDRESFIIHLPKLKLESSINLIPLMNRMGMTRFSSQVDAEFANINPSLFVEMAKQKVKLEVNERGVKASSGTVVGLAERAMPNSYWFDHPFYFFIHHRTTGEIIFTGKITNPLKS